MALVIRPTARLMSQGYVSSMFFRPPLVIRGFTLLFTMLEMALTWTPHPIPKEVSVPRTAKVMPSHFMFSPRSRAYMAPPSMVPSFVRTLYLTAIRDSPYLVAMPNTPVSQHHRTAPGPPRAMAVPTPIIFPVPMVEARAVVSAANWLISPLESGSLVTESLMPVKVFL